MADWIKASTVVEKSKRFTEFMAKGKRYFNELLDNGYISSNFGYLKKDWINYGYEIGVLGKPQIIKVTHFDRIHDYYNFPIATTEHEIEEKKQDKRNIIVKNHIQIDSYGTLKRFNIWKEFLRNKREVEKMKLV